MADSHREMSSMRATAHPVRLRILSLLTGAEMSAAEIARELDLTHANASYHVRLLADAGLLAEAGQERIRGGVAKRYRHPWEDGQDVGPLGTREEAEQFLRTMTNELLRRYPQRRSGATMGSLTDAEMWVTPQVWAQVAEQVKQASVLLHGQAQRPRTPGTVHVNLTVAAFEMLDPGSAAPDSAAPDGAPSATADSAALDSAPGATADNAGRGDSTHPVADEAQRP